MQSRNNIGLQKIPPAKRALAIALLVVLPMGVDAQQPGKAATPQPAEASESETTVTEQSPIEPIADSEPENDIIKQIGSELDELVSRRVQDTNQRGSEAQAGLAKIATRCEVLANSAADDATRLSLLNLRARALSVLARLSPPPQKGPPAPDWLGRLRAVSKQIQALETKGAEAVGGYWLLLTDLARVSSIGGTVDDRQAIAERLLLAYIAEFGESDTAAEYIADTRLSLAKLMDERGDQAGAARQLGAIGALTEDSPRDKQAQPLRERIARIGSPVSFEAITTSLNTWRVSDHAGSPILIHVYADSIPPSLKMAGQINTAINGRTLGGFRVVSLRVGEAVPGVTTPAWPVIPVELEPDGLLDQLGVEAIPTLIWLDDKGRLASIGRTLSVLDQQPRPVDRIKKEGTPKRESKPETEPANEVPSGKSKQSEEPEDEPAYSQ